MKNPRVELVHSVYARGAAGLVSGVIHLEVCAAAEVRWYKAGHKFYRGDRERHGPALALAGP